MTTSGTTIRASLISKYLAVSAQDCQGWGFLDSLTSSLRCGAFFLLRGGPLMSGLPLSEEVDYICKRLDSQRKGDFTAAS
jgi:hypothetical protein